MPIFVIIGASIFCISTTTILLIVPFLLVKNEVTCHNQMKICSAIGAYRIDCIRNNRPKLVDFDDMEDYSKTFWRLWGWGCKRILPKEKFEIIKDYIGKRGV